MQRVGLWAFLFVCAFSQAGCDGDTPAGLGLPPSSDDDVADEEFQEAVLTRVNAFRSEARQCGAQVFPAADPVAWSDRLTSVARAHSRDMARHNFFSHTGSDGLGPDERLTAAGYRWQFVAENLAAGQPTVEIAIMSWIDSPGHCANLMQPLVREIGVARAVDGGSDYKIYWTMKLAEPR